MNKRETGSAYEKMAGEFLKKQGLRVLVFNFRTRNGEIDVIAREGDTIVFVEVKYRSSSRSGYPQEAVDGRKQRKICRTADYYRMTHGLGEFSPVRFDIVAICGKEINWIKNAFTYQT